MPEKAAKSTLKQAQNTQKSTVRLPTPAQHGSHLLDLPSELLSHLIAYFDPLTLAASDSVCRLLHAHISQDTVWRCAFLQHFFGISPDLDLLNKPPRLVLLRRGESSWRAEFQKHWVLARQWEKTRKPTSVTHKPHRTPITAIHVMQSPRNAQGAQPNWAILTASLSAGTVARSFPFTGKVVRGLFDASNTATVLGLGVNPNFQEVFSNVSALALASSGGTGFMLWGLRSGSVAVTVASKAMDPGCSARMIKCSLADAHPVQVEDIAVDNGINGSELFVTGAADGSVKLWNLPTNQRAQLNCIWTGTYFDGSDSVSQAVALVGVPCLKVALDVSCQVVAAGYVDGTVLIWFGVNASSPDSPSVKCVQIPPLVLPSPPSTLRIHAQSRTSVSILIHCSTDLHFCRLKVDREAGLIRRLRFGGGPLGPLHAITVEFVKQEKEGIRTPANSALPSGLSSFVGTPTILSSAPSTPLPSSPSPVFVPPQIQLTLPTPGSGSAPRPRSFVAAGDSLGRVCVWDWDSEEEVVRSAGSKMASGDDSTSNEGEPEIQAAVAWDALDGEGVSAIAWGDVVVAVGSARGSTFIFDSLTLQLLRRIPTPSPSSAHHEQKPVSQIIVESDTVLISVESQVLAWHARRDSDKGANAWGKSPKGKRSTNGKAGGGTVAKWQQRNELNSEISSSLSQIKDEHTRVQPALRRARAQAGALAEMGLDEADAVQYLMMLSRDEEDARQAANEAALREVELDISRETPHGSPTNSTRSSVPSASTSPSSRRSGRSVYIPASRGPRVNVDDIPDDNPFLGGGGRSPYRSDGSHGAGSRHDGSYGGIDEDEELRLVLELSLVEQ